jgi:hypothetical protein
MKASLYMRLDEEEIAGLQYPIVVEQWDRIGSVRTGYGRQRRAYLKEFDVNERIKAGRWYRKFYQWYLVAGPPQELKITPQEYVFIQRLVHFFATV